jgi:2-methylcitrate dehydratase PrpD
MTARTPALRPARVTVTLADGRAATHARDSYRGDFNEPFSEAELHGKFRELAGTVLSAAGVEATLRLIDECEDWPDIGVLTRCLRQYGRAEDPMRD